MRGCNRGAPHRCAWRTVVALPLWHSAARGGERAVRERSTPTGPLREHSRLPLVRIASCRPLSYSPSAGVVLRCCHRMNPAKPLDLTLEVAPKARFDVVELRSRFAAEHAALKAYSNCLYWSSHTTAGFLDRSISARLRAQHVSTYVEAFRTLFPEGAGYEHDQLDRRSDLDAIQRVSEPKNADSHLAFMASGLRPCVTHPNRDGEAVCFVDLDGIIDGRPRRRLTRLIGFRTERVVGKTRIEVPVSQHPIDSVNLKDP